MVFLAADTAIFVFEGDDPHAVLGALTGDNGQPVLGAWESLVDGTPKVAREAYSWISPAHEQGNPRASSATARDPRPRRQEPWSIEAADLRPRPQR